MNRRTGHIVTMAITLALGASMTAFQAPPQPAPAPAAGADNVGVKVAQMTTPVQGQPFRFSLCAGQPLAAGVASTVCHSASANGVTGTAGTNAIINFKLQTGSFLPPGLILDGNGVISGTTTADLSKVSVKICVFKVGAIGSNFNCQGQTVGFNGGNAVVLNAPPAAPAAAPVPAGVSPSIPAPVPAGGTAAGGGGIGKAIKWTLLAGGTVAGAVVAADALAQLEELSYTEPTTTTTSTPTSNTTSNPNYRYANWNCGASTQCAAVFGAVTGSAGPFCNNTNCLEWARTYGGNTTCSSAAQFTILNRAPAGTCG